MTSGEEIVAWLHGLESTLRSVRDGRAPSTGEERETMRQRAGIYEGIADDIKRKWPALFDQAAPMPGAADPRALVARLRSRADYLLDRPNAPSLPGYREVDGLRSAADIVEAWIREPASGPSSSPEDPAFEWIEDLKARIRRETIEECAKAAAFAGLDEVTNAIRALLAKGPAR